MPQSQGALPEYRNSFLIDGYTYKASIRFPTEVREIAGEQPHSHARYELHACAEGSVALQFEDRAPFVLEAGQCCIIPPKVFHTRKTSSGSGKCYVMLLNCPKGAPLQLSGEPCIPLGNSKTLLSCLQLLEREMRGRKIGSDNVIQGISNLLMVSILRELTVLPAERPLQALDAVNQREDLIDNYFALHYWYDISAQDLADRIGVTTRQLARIMQQRYGCTFRQRLLEIRLYHARRYLTASEEPIWQIATACGFSCQGAFATAFRKSVGCTPSEYRLTNGKGKL